MSDTKNIALLEITRAVNDAQEASEHWNEIYMSNDGKYMRLTHRRNMMAITVNVKADKVNLEMQHREGFVDDSCDITADALNSAINTLHNDTLAKYPPRPFR